MIISLDKAQELDPLITIDDLRAYEQMVRALTNNTFQNIGIRYGIASFSGPATIELKEAPFGLREGDTIEISRSVFNDGLVTVDGIDGNTLTVSDLPADFYEGAFAGAFITKIQYPADIKYGVAGLIEYKAKMGSKLGIKSEAIARMSVTYYDINAADNIEGFPASKFSFLAKYEKMRWG